MRLEGFERLLEHEHLLTLVGDAEVPVQPRALSEPRALEALLAEAAEGRKVGPQEAHAEGVDGLHHHAPLE